MSPDYPPTVVFATRMNGPALARFENTFNGTRDRNNHYSEEAQWVPQYVLEDVLRQHASSLPGVTVSFNTELAPFSQSGEGVSAELRNVTSGEIRRVESAYLIGARQRPSTRCSMARKP
jgi:2-polyprenyl-6-methoxyphenol hydroxylase-like FAD-dependent oxidoreductase